MWLEIFSKIIPDFLKVSTTTQPPAWEVFKRLAAINLNKIYVENVRSLFNTTTDRARAICEDAVKSGLFIIGYELRCPDGSVALSVEGNQEIPPYVDCYEEVDGDYESTEYRTEDLKRETYYRLA